MSQEVSKNEHTIQGESPARAGETERQLIRRAKRATRRKFPAEEKIRIVMERIRAEVSIADQLQRGDQYELDGDGPKRSPPIVASETVAITLE